MFFLFVFFLLHSSVTSVQECPDEKTVGNTCYTRVAMIDTTEYGCMENCTYKKTQGSDSGHYCFKRGILPVTESECVYNGTDITITDNPGCVVQPNTQMVSHGAKGIPDYFPFHSNSENVCAHYCHAVLPYCEYWTYNYGGKGLCWLMTTPGFTYPYGGAVTGNKACTGAGAGPIEPGFDIGVTCGSGIKEQFCFQCGISKDNCQGNSPNSSCVLSPSGNCIPRSTTIQIEIGLGVLCGSGIEEQHCFQCGKSKDNCQGNSPNSSCVLSPSGNCIPRKPAIEIENGLGVVCGSGTQEQHCFQCGETKDNCQGNSPNSSCVLTNSGNCIPRWPTNEFDFGPYMGSVLESLEEFEDNTDSNILFPSPDSCGFFKKIKCLTQLGVGLAGCVTCKRDVTCWRSCLKDKICGLSSYCLPGGPCFDDLFGKISSVLRNIGLPPQEIKEILEALRNFVCSK